MSLDPDSPTFKILPRGGCVDFREPPETWIYGPKDLITGCLAQTHFGGALQSPFTVIHHLILGKALLLKQALLAQIRIQDHPDAEDLLDLWFADPGDILNLWLAHDLHEGIVGDVASPLKRVLPEYQTLEQAVARDVHRRLGLTFPTREVAVAVERLDRTVRFLEAIHLGRPTLARHFRARLAKNDLTALDSGPFRQLVQRIGNSRRTPMWVEQIQSWADQRWIKDPPEDPTDV